MSENILATRVATRRSAPRPWSWFVWAGVGSIGVALLFAIDPAGSGIFPPCAFHTITGLHCPGCGTTRALHQVLHGNLSAAFALNPLMILAIPPLAYAAVSTSVRRLSGRQIPTVFIPAAWIWGLLGVVILFWVLRNIPAYPMNLLAPSG